MHALPVRLFPFTVLIWIRAVIRVVEVRPCRWSYMIDGEFPVDLYDPTWGLTTFPSPEDAQQAAERRVAI